ncbi:transglutaminase-like domain-containing protein [Anaerovorax odorimutans]|uniref:Transglutaminase-like domain-containing protein n=1 Tax=Anaerovorax odorimutans TaxID=109327 RepID=A0ABT1RKD7_9FIRM|nr:transglutaminase-like domain-containing protein [Anaerovorax odorimutans]
MTRKKEAQTTMDLVQITEENSRHPGRRVIFELLLAIALSVGCWYTFFSMFPNPVDPLISILLIAGLPIGLYFLCWNPFLGRFLVFYVFLLTAVFFVLAYESVWNGLMVMANIIIEVLNDQMKAGLVPFEVTGDTVDWSTDVFLAMIPIILLASMAIVHSIYHKEPLLGFVLTAIPVMIGLCLKIEPSVWLLILLLLCWTGLLVLSAVARPVSRKKNRPIYIQNAKNSSLPYIFLSITLVLLLGYVTIFSGEDYRPPQTVEDAKAAVVAAEQHLRYDKLGGSEIDQLTKGDLTKSHPLAYTDSTVLSLKTQMAQPMYLRGFTGGNFEKDKWSEAPEGAYSGEFTGMIEWLEKKDFYPWMQQDRLYRMSKDYDFYSVDVNNINGNSKYMYLPYEAVIGGDTAPGEVDYEKDYGAFTKGLAGQREYTFKTFQPKFNDYSEESIADWLSELKKSPDWAAYSEAEAVYRRYVYDTYLYVSNKDAAALGASGIEKCEGKTIDYTLHYIRKNFDEEFTYDSQQGKAPGRKGELDYFMNDSYSGNDMHFATAAALMFRKAGIPARYAEGYYLSPEYMKLYTGMSDLTVDVPDSLAHSWVEIYIDEIGWFPVEVVPGYYDMAKQQTQEKEEDEKIKEDTKKNYEDQVPEDNQPQEKQEDEKKTINPLWFVLLAVLLLIAVYEILGRWRIRKLLASFGTVRTDAQVYAMYRYVGKVMAFDKHPLPANPYDKLEEISAAYDAVTEIRFAEFLRMVNKVRFGEGDLSEEEHKKMARYAVKAGSHIYASSKRGRKFLMKFILFYV